MKWLSFITITVLTACSSLDRFTPGSYVDIPRAPVGMVEVFGYVKHPKLIKWHEGLTVGECVLSAGGYASLANRNDLLLLEPVVRRGGVK